MWVSPLVNFFFWSLKSKIIILIYFKKLTFPLQWVEGKAGSITPLNTYQLSFRNKGICPAGNNTPVMPALWNREQESSLATKGVWSQSGLQKTLCGIKRKKCFHLSHIGQFKIQLTQRFKSPGPEVFSVSPDAKVRPAVYREPSSSTP